MVGGRVSRRLQAAQPAFFACGSAPDCPNYFKNIF
jgi:hypothetical protein